MDEKKPNPLICDHGQLRRQCPVCERDGYIVQLRDALIVAQAYVEDARLIGGFKPGVVEGHIRQIQTALNETKWIEEARP